MLPYKRGEDMKTVELDTLPRISFAHMYQAEKYENTIPPIERRIEICYVDEGCITITKGGDVFVAEKVISSALFLTTSPKYSHRSFTATIPSVLRRIGGCYPTI